MFCAYTSPRYQMGVYRTIGPLVSISHSNGMNIEIFIKDLPGTT